MVRIKHRYLLINILYPDPPSQSTSSTTAKTQPHSTSGPLPPPPPHLPAVVQFHQPTPDDLTPQILARIIKDQIALLYGDYGVGVTAGSLNVKYLSPATSTAIIRCSRSHYRLVWAALSFMTHLPSSSSPSSSKQLSPRPCVFRVVRVSGTIRKIEEEAVKRARAFILRAKRENKDNGLVGLDALLG